MSAQVILYRMPNGKPGQVTRLEHSTVEAGFLLNNTRAALFVAIDAASRKFVPATTVASIYGILTRSYPTMTANDTSWPVWDTTTGNEPPIMLAIKSVGILRSGYETVPFEGDQEVLKGDPVYMNITAPTTTGQPLIGAFVNSTFANAVLVPNCTYNGPALPGDIVEVIYNI